MQPTPFIDGFAPPTEHTLSAQDGTSLRLRIVHARSAKASVIVVHGLDDHLERYGALSDFLKQSGYEIWLYDQRGHGESGGVRNHIARFSEYVTDLERVHQAALAAHASPPHVFGHSMGAVVALLAAMRHPDRWRSVIVQACPLVPGRNIPKMIEALARAVRPLLPRLRASTGIDPDELSRDVAVIGAYRRDPRVTGSVTLSWAVEFLDALHRLREGVSAITSPLLILHGEDDRIAGLAGSRWLAAHAGAKDKLLRTYPHLKHELHNELPPDRERVFADLAAWLERH